MVREKLGKGMIESRMMGVGYVIVGLGVVDWFGEGKTGGGIGKWFCKRVVKGRYSDAVMSECKGVGVRWVLE